jgi:hypothetical protein
MTMEVREEPEKADDPIHRNDEPDSIKIDERELQPRKQPKLTVSTVRGMKMDERKNI